MPSDRSQRLKLYAGDSHECSYLGDRQSQMHYVDPALALNPAIYGALLQQGFRRSGGWVYRPGCDSCRQCIAARIPVEHFSPNRSQRRAVAANGDLSLNWHNAEITDEHFELYGRYLSGRHAGGGMEGASRKECSDFLLADWCDTRLLDFRLDGRLVSTAVTDVVPGALSSIYTFFDPRLRRRGLGTYGVLVQIDQARQLGLKHLYLGFWVPDSAKMAYKERFRPLEILTDIEWRRFESGTPLTGAS